MKENTRKGMVANLSDAALADAYDDGLAFQEDQRFNYGVIFGKLHEKYRKYFDKKSAVRFLMEDMTKEIVKRWREENSLSKRM